MKHTCTCCNKMFDSDKLISLNSWYCKKKLRWLSSGSITIAGPSSLWDDTIIHGPKCTHLWSGHEDDHIGHAEQHADSDDQDDQGLGATSIYAIVYYELQANESHLVNSLRLNYQTRHHTNYQLLHQWHVQCGQAMLFRFLVTSWTMLPMAICSWYMSPPSTYSPWAQWLHNFFRATNCNTPTSFPTTSLPIPSQQAWNI